MSSRLIRNDQTKDISSDENDLFPVIKKGIHCNVIESNSKVVQ